MGTAKKNTTNTNTGKKTETEKTTNKNNSNLEGDTKMETNKTVNNEVDVQDNDEKEIDLIGTTNETPENIAEYFNEEEVLEGTEGKEFLLKNVLKDHGSSIDIIEGKTSKELEAEAAAKVNENNEETKSKVEELNVDFIRYLEFEAIRDINAFSKVADAFKKNKSTSLNALIKSDEIELSIAAGLVYMGIVKHDFSGNVGEYVINAYEAVKKPVNEETSAFNETTEPKVEVDDKKKVVIQMQQRAYDSIFTSKVKESVTMKNNKQTTRTAHSIISHNTNTEFAKRQALYSC